MKKLFIALLAVVMVASLFTVAAAEDKLSLSGTMRVRAWDVENYYDFDDNAKSDEQSYWDQRFRVGATIKANDAVSGHLRFDFAEDTWGSGNWTTSYSGPDYTGARYNEGSELQVDRAYLQVVQDMYTLKAGQHFFGTGLAYTVVDSNVTGITATIKLPVTIDLHYAKISESGSNNDDDAFDDVDMYAAQVKYAQDMFSVGAFYAAIEDSTPSDNSVNSIGVFGSVNLGPVVLKAEFDHFDGDRTPTIEYVGDQLWVNAEWKMDTLILGADIFYAAGASTDGTEFQVEGLTDWNEWWQHSYGPFIGDFLPTPDDLFDFTGDSAGAVGGSIYAKFNPMEGLLLWAQLCYLEAEEDANTPYDDMTIVNLSAEYEFVPNAKIAAMYSTTLVSTDSSATPDDAAQTLVGRLEIAF